MKDVEEVCIPGKLDHTDRGRYRGVMAGISLRSRCAALDAMERFGCDVSLAFNDTAESGLSEMWVWEGC